MSKNGFAFHAIMKFVALQNCECIHFVNISLNVILYIRLFKFLICAFIVCDGKKLCRVVFCARVGSDSIVFLR